LRSGRCDYEAGVRCAVVACENEMQLISALSVCLFCTAIPTKVSSCCGVISPAACSHTTHPGVCVAKSYPSRWHLLHLSTAPSVGFSGGHLHLPDPWMAYQRCTPRPPYPCSHFFTPVSGSCKGKCALCTIDWWSSDRSEWVNIRGCCDGTVLYFPIIFVVPALAHPRHSSTTMTSPLPIQINFSTIFLNLIYQKWCFTFIGKMCAAVGSIYKTTALDYSRISLNPIRFIACNLLKGESH
jgi:hypothetical protein